MVEQCQRIVDCSHLNLKMEADGNNYIYLAGSL